MMPMLGRDPGVTLAAFAIHRLASDRLRRTPAWDCGYPDQSAATQYTASSFAQPIRRVFGTLVFHAREHGDMPGPGDVRPAFAGLHPAHLGHGHSRPTGLGAVALAEGVCCIVHLISSAVDTFSSRY
jgi:hypothetical protein